MAKLKDLKVAIGLSKEGLTKLNSDLRTTKANFKRNFGEIGAMATNMGKNLTMAITAPLAGMAAVSLNAFNQQRKAIAQVEAGLKSTGAAVGFTSGQLQKMASDLQSKTLFGDEEILKNATAQLLTFTNIAGDQFAEAQKSALNLATRLDGDLKSASIMLGKALNDPVKNLSAMSRAGIQFSEDQKEVINALVESGNMAEAQTIILKELEKQYGGSAEAAAAAGMGPFTQLKNTLGDVSEQFGALINDMIKPLIPKIKALADRFANLSERQKKFLVVLGGLASMVGPILLLVGALVSAAGALAGVAAVAAPVMLVVTALTAVGLAVAALTGELRQLSEAEQINADAAREQGRAYAEVNQSNQKLRSSVALLISEYERANTTEERQKEILNELSGKHSDLKTAIDNGKTSVEDLKGAFSDLNETLEKNAQLTSLQAARKYYEGLLAPIQEQQGQALAEVFSVFGEKTTDVDIQFNERGFIDLYASLDKMGLQTNKTIRAAVGEYNDLVQKAENANFIAEKGIERINQQVEALGVSATETGNAMGDVGQGVGDGGEDKATKSSKDRKKAFEEEWNEATRLTEAQQALEEATFQQVVTTQDLKEASEGLRRAYGEMSGEIEEIPFDEFEEAVFEEDELQLIEDGTKLLNKAAFAAANMGKAFNLTSQLTEAAFNNIKDKSQGFHLVVKQMLEDLLKKAIALAAAFAAMSIFMGPSAMAKSGIGSFKDFMMGGLGFGNIPQMASGGLFTGASLAMVGEGPGTSLSNPEVVAPLDKLQSMIGGGNVTVTGRLDGRDILISSERANIDRNRIRGF